MEFPSEEINNYSRQFSSPEPKFLEDLNRETNAKILMPRMLSGHLQGRALSMLCHMIRPERILEIGTYTGYSAICMAEGLSENGILHTIEVNDELKSMIIKYVSDAGLTGKIKLHIGNALDIIPELNEVFDLVFIDADKINYSKYYSLVFPNVRSGGFIIADNVLWSGKVLAMQKDMDKDTLAIHEFNRLIQNDERVENVLVPVRDGLMIARKLT
ncbi:MAG: O-methyltransferase [Bacteroidetes bacterium]|nr:MAG: O-methyltransferase [Bacteroidota bacterium]REK07627.1 MAG: O-methyltransferase [Bacteroidota bacterium]REK31791.1 MAG: O-methyltransferase [Bacteroidota bacterium]REK50148.1 MAG: O-methyltransferase [Bacteroidota bacterium]